DPFLCALLDFEPHPRSEAQDAQQADRLIREAMNSQRPDFGTLDVGQSIGWVQEQAAGSRVQGNSDGVQREIAPAEILHNRGPANFRTRSRANIMVVPRGGDTSFAVTSEQYFHLPQLFIFGEN